MINDNYSRNYQQLLIIKKFSVFCVIKFTFMFSQLLKTCVVIHQKMSIHSMKFQVQSHKNLHCTDTIPQGPVSFCNKNL